MYAFVLDGDVEIDGEKLGKHDGIGLSDADAISMKADSDAEVLLMEVQMG